MLEVIFGIFVVCLSAIGLIEIFKIVSVSFLNQQEFNKNIILLIPIYGHDEKIEMILRNAMVSTKWFGSTDNRRIVCLDLGMDAETHKICEIFSEEFDSVELCTLKEFNSIMEQSIVNLG